MQAAAVRNCEVLSSGSHGGSWKGGSTREGEAVRISARRPRRPMFHLRSRHGQYKNTYSLTRAAAPSVILRLSITNSDDYHSQRTRRKDKPLARSYPSFTATNELLLTPLNTTATSSSSLMIKFTHVNSSHGRVPAHEMGQGVTTRQA